jgi:hypothetical protein
VTIEFSNHPEYDDKAPELQKYRDLYEGDHAVLIRPQYLWPHELESSNKIKGTDPQTGQQLTVGEYLRTIRARRSRYLNVMESIVSAWISLLFHKPIKMGREQVLKTLSKAQLQKRIFEMVILLSLWTHLAACLETKKNRPPPGLDPTWNYLTDSQLKTGSILKAESSEESISGSDTSTRL